MVISFKKCDEKEVSNLADKYSLKRKTLSGMVWKTAERVGAQGVGFFVSLVLARLLSPEDYGLIALISVFITISNVFIQSGLGTALIQKKDADDLDYSTVFYCSVGISCIAYCILFFSASYIADFYDAQTLVPIIRVLSISLIFNGVNTVQNAYVSKTMQFRKFFFATLIGTVLSAFVGVYLAYRGAGVWALVAQQLVNTSIDTFMLWFSIDWKPKLIFSWQRLKQLYGYGWKLLVGGLFEHFYNNVYGLIIGKIYSKEFLGLYNKGVNFPNLITSNVLGPIQSVLLPALATTQDNIHQMKKLLRQSIRMSSYVFFPILLGMAAVSDALVGLLLTDKWNDCIPFIQISCLTLSFVPIQIVNIQAICAIGKSDICLKLEIAKEMIGYTLLFISIPFGINAMVIGRAVQSMLAFVVDAIPNKKLFGYSAFEQIKDILPPLFISAIMYVCVFMLGTLGMSDLITLMTQILAGVLIYVLLSIAFCAESFRYILQIVKYQGRPGNKK